jgi:hypothetical protein
MRTLAGKRKKKKELDKGQPSKAGRCQLHPSLLRVCVPCTESFTTCVCTVYRVVYYNYFTYKGGRLQHLYFVCTVYRVPCTVYRVPCTVYRVLYDYYFTYTGDRLQWHPSWR